jgi:hypothetical protein
MTNHDNDAPTKDATGLDAHELISLAWRSGLSAAISQEPKEEADAQNPER